MCPRALKARRYEAVILAHVAEVALSAGRKGEALALAREGRGISSETGAGFVGPTLCGLLGLLEPRREDQDAALASGEALLAQGSVGHNHFWFHRNAIELALQERDWDEVDRHADALAAYTQAERLPFSDLLTARGHALAAFGRGALGPNLVATLSGLRDEALAAGVKMALPALEAALSAG